jgi:hypothetical protein
MVKIVSAFMREPCDKCVKYDDIHKASFLAVGVYATDC